MGGRPSASRTSTRRQRPRVRGALPGRGGKEDQGLWGGGGRGGGGGCREFRGSLPAAGRKKPPGRGIPPRGGVPPPGAGHLSHGERAEGQSRRKGFPQLR